VDPAIKYDNLDLRIKRSGDGTFVIEAESLRGGREVDVAAEAIADHA
jgi:hypothetical protein